MHKSIIQNSTVGGSVIVRVSEVFVVSELSSIWLAYLFPKKQRWKSDHPLGIISMASPSLFKCPREFGANARILFADQARRLSHSTNTSVTGLK